MPLRRTIEHRELQPCFPVVGLGPEKVLHRIDRLVEFPFARQENRPRSGYVLMVDKGGPKFKESSSNFVRGRACCIW